MTTQPIHDQTTPVKFLPLGTPDGYMRWTHVDQITTVSGGFYDREWCQLAQIRNQEIHDVELVDGRRLVMPDAVFFDQFRPHWYRPADAGAIRTERGA
jgi:hypothetical protein